MTEPTERIPQHRHCLLCGKAYTSGDGKYCSAECKSQKAAELKKTKNKLLIIWAIAVGLMIFAIVVTKL